MPRDRATDAARLESAAATLRGSSRAFTRRNLYHAWKRAGGEATFEEFGRGPLARRLARGSVEGLLPPAVRWDGPRLGREWDAYFPRSILVVDSHSVLDLFIASGVLTTARMAVVCIDGSPGHVVEWLQRGFLGGHRAPVGYLHDTATVFYPFAVEPLASLVRAAQGEPVDFIDLGLPPHGALVRELPLVREGWGTKPKARERVTELEAIPPCAMLAFAARRLMARVPGDPRMAPLVREEQGDRAT